MADDWTEYIDSRSGAPFYVNEITGEKKWQRPSHLPVSTVANEWIECLDQQTEFYYYLNTRTYESTWEMPPDFQVFIGTETQRRETAWANSTRLSKVEEINEDDLFADDLLTEESDIEYAISVKVPPPPPERKKKVPLPSIAENEPPPKSTLASVLAQSLSVSKPKLPAPPHVRQTPQPAPPPVRQTPQPAPVPKRQAPPTKERPRPIIPKHFTLPNNYFPIPTEGGNQAQRRPPPPPPRRSTVVEEPKRAPPPLPSYFQIQAPTSSNAVADEQDIVSVFLDDIQPGVGSMRSAVDAFEQSYFAAKFYLSAEQIYDLLFGPPYTSRGLLWAIGQHSRVNFELLKISAGKALNLLVRLLSNENHSASMFLSTFITGEMSQYDAMHLDEHLLPDNFETGSKESALYIKDLLIQHNLTPKKPIRAPPPRIAPRPPPPVSIPAPIPPTHASMPRRATIDQKKEEQPKPIAGNRRAFWQVLLKFFSPRGRKNREEVEKLGILKKEKIFGVEISKVAEEFGSFGVPEIVTVGLGYLKDNHLHEEGLFRVSGGHSEILDLKVKCDYDGKLPSFTGLNPHAISGLVKLYFRELPDCLLLFKNYDSILDAIKIENYKGIDDVIESLPEVNRKTLIYLLDFLNILESHSDINKMARKNLAIVFGPTLLRRDKPSLADMQDSMDVVAVIVYLLDKNSSRDKTSDAKHHQRNQSVGMPVPAIPKTVYGPPPIPSHHRTHSGRTPPKLPTERRMPPPPRRTVSETPGWRKYNDPTTGKDYYYNSVTQQSSWTNPL